MRAGLVAFLAFFDDEPGCGRLLVCEAPASDGVLAARCEQQVSGVVTGLLDDGGPLAIGELMPDPQLAAELAAGGVLAVIRRRLRERDGRSFVELAPTLMSFIVGPYLGQAAAQAELTGRSASASEATVSGAAPAEEAERHSGELPIRVTHRTLLVLRVIEATPRASNREVARAAGLSDEGQASRLLSRLEGRGLTENVGGGAAHGEANAWLLTAEGQRVLGVAGGMARTGRHIRHGGGGRKGCGA